MPSLADITVKKADGTTDIVWSGVQPSSGDTVPCVWISQTVGSALAHRPWMRIKSRDNANKTLRRIDGEVSFPETATGADSITRVVNTVNAKFDVGVPNGMADTAVAEAVHQTMNLFASALVKEILTSRRAAT